MVLNERPHLDLYFRSLDQRSLISAETIASARSLVPLPSAKLFLGVVRLVDLFLFFRYR